jgi:Ca2+-transporting ATPase
MAAAVILLLVAVLAVPDLRHLMGLDGPWPPVLAAGAVLLTLCLAWLELLRLTMARLTARTMSAM